MFNRNDVIKIKEVITVDELAELWGVRSIDIDCFIEQGLLQASAITSKGELVTLDNPIIDRTNSLSDNGDYEYIWVYKLNSKDEFVCKGAARITKENRLEFENKHDNNRASTVKLSPVLLSNSKERHYQLIIAALINRDDEHAGKVKSNEQFASLLTSHCEKLGVTVKSSNWNRLLSDSVKHFNSEKQIKTT